MSAPSYRYTDHPALVGAFAHTFELLGRIPCDVLATPHASATARWDRVAAGSLIDGEACRRDATAARARLDARLSDERDQGVRDRPAVDDRRP